MATIQQQKRGTSDRWSALDPVLAAGEIGYETDTVKFKIGDGTTPWSSLSYFSTTSGGGGSGTVTSVDLSVPTGLTISNNPITTSGTLAIGLASGYSIPDTTSQGHWTAAYNWGDHASAGYQPGDADLTAIAGLALDGVLRKTSGVWGMDSATYLTSGSSLNANNLSGTIQGGVLGNSSLYVGTTQIALNRSTANLALTGITSITGGTGTTTITFTSADNTGTPTGAVLLTSGVATSSTAGTVKVDSGNNGTPGTGGANVGIGTINASSVTIGRTGITTTIAGTLAATIPGIGSTIQGWDADLDAVAALSTTGLASRTGAGTWAIVTDNSTNWNTAYTDRNKWDGGSTGLTASTGRASLGANTVGSNIFTLTNPSATTFLKINPDNSITAENASTHVASLGANTIGQNIFTLANPSAITFLRMNADNTVSALSDVNFRAAIGAGTGNGTVTSVTGTSPVSSSGGTTPAISLASGYGDTQSPYGSKTQNYVLAGPTTPTPAAPSFRALVSGDIPDLSGTYVAVSGGNAATATKTTTTVTGTNVADLLYASIADNDYFRLRVGGTATNAGYAEIATADDGTEPIYVRQYTGVFTTLTRTATLLDGSGNTIFPGDMTIQGGDILLGTTSSATTIKTVAATGAVSGSLTIATGDTITSGASGNISVDVGSGASSNGTISIGTTNASAITIGRTGVTTTINGTFSPAALAASVLTGTIPSTVLGNSTVYIGTTAVALNRTTANLALTGITSITGGTGTTALAIASADTTGAASGSVTVSSGVATSSTAGTVRVDSGNNGTPGSGGANVAIGSINASSVTIGRATITTTIAGTLSATISGYVPTTTTIWGQALSGDVTGNLTSVGTITGTSGTTLAISQVSISGTTGNAISIAGGSNTQSTGTPTGGSISITGGAQTNATPVGTGGAVTISGGTGGTNGGGGDVNIRGGIGGGNGNGSVNIGTTSSTAAVTIGNSGTTVNIQNPLLTSVSVVGGGGGEGGQINFARVTDGNQYWAIDSFGTSGTPSLRFIENATTQLTLATGGVATFAGAVKLRAGSTTTDTAPLYFASSTSLLSSVTARAMEFNNKALYFTPSTTPGRAIVATPFYKIVAADNTTLINVSPGVPTTYSAFGTNGIALETGVAYEVEMVLLVSATTASNSSTLIITPGSPTGAAVPSASQLYYDYSASTTVMTNAAATSSVLRAGTTAFPALNTITIATGTTQYVKAYMKGIINIATGGNFTIRMAFTPGAAGTVTGTIYAGSYLKITPLGAEGLTDIGTWA